MNCARTRCPPSPDRSAARACDHLLRGPRSGQTVGQRDGPPGPGFQIARQEAHRGPVEQLAGERRSLAGPPERRVDWPEQCVTRTTDTAANDDELDVVGEDELVN